MPLASSGAGESRRPSIAGVRQVAKAAGVSLGTVSNVLNNPSRVSSATRIRVEAAMAELEFVPSRAAGQLRSGRSALIGVVVPDVGNPFWASVLSGIEEVLEKRALTLVVGSTHQDSAREQRMLEAQASYGVDGFIVAPIAPSDKLLKPFLSKRYGVVALDSDLSDGEFPSVSLDDVHGARLAVTHLLQQGHRKLVFVNGPRSVTWCNSRREGVRSGLREHGLSLRDSLREVIVRDLTVSEGLNAVERIVGGPDGATGIMCANDLLALGVLRGLHSRGLRVPEDYALVGYDDVNFAAALSPPLTSVHQPSHDMGVAAARLLLDREDGQANRHIKFQPRLIPRASSRRMVSPSPG